MTAFRYTAYTAAGKRRRGTMVADSRAQATETLRAQGLFATEIESRNAPKPTRLFRRRIGLSADERMVFTRQLAVLLSAEVSLEVALDTVSQSGGSHRIDSVAVAARAALREGENLSDSLAASGAGFPPYYLASVEAGERSGELDRVFEELATHLENVAGDQSRIATALIYPAFVAAVSLVICAILVTSVAPQIVAMFETTGRPLPAITTALLSATDWLEANWIVCLAGLIGSVIGFRALLGVPAFRDRWDGVLLRLPVVGRILRLSAAHQYLQTLALLLSSRQTALDTVECAAGVLHQRRFQTEAAQVATSIRHGDSLTAALQNLTIIPPVCRQLIAAGEQSARLALMTERATRLVDGWLKNDRKRLTALLDPLLMMVVGGFVLVIVLAILLPIFDLQSAIGGSSF